MSEDGERFEPVLLVLPASVLAQLDRLRAERWEQLPFELQSAVRKVCVAMGWSLDSFVVGMVVAGNIGMWSAEMARLTPIDPATVPGMPVDDGALECLSMVLDLHESDGEPSAFCVECSQSWPCATVRLIRAEATA